MLRQMSLSLLKPEEVMVTGVHLSIQEITIKAKFYASDDNKWELWNGIGTAYSISESSTQPFSDGATLLELSIDTSANPNVNKF